MKKANHRQRLSATLRLKIRRIRQLIAIVMMAFGWENMPAVNVEKSVFSEV
jgi:hypothetical protein